MKGASILGRLAPPATHAHKEELSKTRLNEGSREVHGFRCKLATCKCQELPLSNENNPNAACMDEIEKTERRAVYR